MDHSLTPFSAVILWMFRQMTETYLVKMISVQANANVRKEKPCFFYNHTGVQKASIIEELPIIQIKPCVYG